MREERLAGLTVRITGGSDGQGGGDGPLVVLLHGFGAPGTDLIPLSQVLGAPPGTRFAFPAAPVVFSMGLGEARAWWMIDVMALERALARGEFRDLSQDEPEGMVEARDQVAGCLDELERLLRPSRVVIGGFSQGSMLATDVALRSDRPLAGLLLFSGTLLCEAEWRSLAPRRAGLRVFQCHGRQDPLLPFAMAERLRDLLTEAGLPVSFVPFDGAHEIPPPALLGARGFLGEALVVPAGEGPAGTGDEEE